MIAAMGREPSKWAHAHSAMDRGHFASLALTHVQYLPGDPWSMPLALITLAPPFLLVSYVSVLLVRRELTIVLGFIGQILCEAVNLGLKRTFKQGRPTDFLGTGYGMPSSHSQFAGYFAAFWTCHLLRFRPGMSQRAAKRHSDQSSWTLISALRTAEHYLLLALILAGCTIVPYSRYHLAYHSAPQILVGLSAGFACGLAWYYVAEVLGRRRLSFLGRSVHDLILDNPVCVALRLRDSWAVWDDAGVEAEYGLWQSGRRALMQDEQELRNRSNDKHVEHILHALRLASLCEATTTAFCVGCVITDAESGRVLATGYSREEPGNTHAEEVALNKLTAMCSQAKSEAGAGETARKLNLYTSMEPCSERLSKKSPCVERILAFNEARHTGLTFSNQQDDRPLRIVAILQGVKEPDDFIAEAAGTKQLRERGGGLTVSTVRPGIHFERRVNTQTDVLRLQPGWLEREAVRLAKKGHPDQPAVHDVDEERVWREPDWRPSSSTLQAQSRAASGALDGASAFTTARAGKCETSAAARNRLNAVSGASKHR